MFERIRSFARAAVQAVRSAFQGFGRGAASRSAQQAAAAQQQQQAAQAAQREYLGRHEAPAGRHEAPAGRHQIFTPGYEGRHAATSARINEIFANEINRVRDGGDSLLIGPNAKQKVNIFFAATRDAWQGYPVDQRYDRIIAKTGSSNLREAFEKVMADQEAQGVFDEDSGYTDEEPTTPEPRYRSLPYSGKEA